MHRVGAVAARSTRNATWLQKNRPRPRGGHLFFPARANIMNISAASRRRLRFARRTLDDIGVDPAHGTLYGRPPLAAETAAWLRNPSVNSLMKSICFFRSDSLAAIGAPNSM